MIAANAGQRIRRRAATVVEGAAVISVFLLFIFGIFEYARYLMFLHVASNAVRDAGRYASVNVDKPTSFPDTPYTTGSLVYPSIKDYALNRLGGCEKMLDTGYAFEVFACDATQLAQTPPVLAVKQVTVGASTRNAYWNEASFTERICVRLKGTYRMALPSFLYASPAINVNIATVNGSES